MWCLPPSWKSHALGVVNCNFCALFFVMRACGFTSDPRDQQKDPSLLTVRALQCWGAIFPSLLWSRIAPVSGMVTLCLCDNASVIHTHYSNGRLYKDLLTASLGLGAACILRPLPCDRLPLQQPAPPLATPFSHSVFSLVCVCVCAHACLIDIKIYEFGYLLLEGFK